MKRKTVNPFVFVFLISLAMSAPAWSADHSICSHGGVGAVGEENINLAKLETGTWQMFSINSDLPYLEVQLWQADYTEQQARYQKTLKAVELAERALNTEAFKNFIFNHEWNGKKQFSDNQGLTNEQIYEKIRMAQELKYSNAPYRAEFNHSIYYTRKSTVGFTNPGNPWINTNTKFLDPFTPAELAGHLVHEWLHLISFLHDQTHPYSVPYAAGYAIRDIAQALSN